MSEEDVSEISIDDEGRLRIYPSLSTYEYIYRSATEVHWNKDGKYLYSPKPIDLNYPIWFAQIIGAVKSEYGASLKISENTKWKNIPERTKEEIMLLMKKEQLQCPSTQVKPNLRALMP